MAVVNVYEVTGFRDWGIGYYDPPTNPRQRDLVYVTYGIYGAEIQPGTTPRKFYSAHYHLWNLPASAQPYVKKFGQSRWHLHGWDLPLSSGDHLEFHK